MGLTGHGAAPYEQRMIHLSRRRFLASGLGAPVLAGPAAGGLAALLYSASVRAEIGDTLVIAAPSSLPAWDPTSPAAAFDAPPQSVWRAVFDPLIGRGPDLELRPALLTAWGWNASRTRIYLNLRDDMTWHDGSKVTIEDLLWSIERAARREPRGDARFWGDITGIATDGLTLTASIRRSPPDLFHRLARSTAFPLPQGYYRKVGARDFENAPVGSGPYKVTAIRPASPGGGPGGEGGEVSLARFEQYWGVKPAFERVVFRFIPDPEARVRAVQSGKAHVLIDPPYDRFKALSREKGLIGRSSPSHQIAFVAINDIGPMKDPNVRRAAHHAIHKPAIVRTLLSGYGRVLETLEPRGAMAHEPDPVVKYDLARAAELLGRSGYSKKRPVRLTLQTTRRHRPMDFETAQAIAGMWQQVGIEASLEVLEPEQIRELASQDRLAPACLRTWDDPSGDPNAITGTLLWGPSNNSVWDTQELDEQIEKLLWEWRDTKKRRAGWRVIGRYAAENAYVIPLYQYVQCIVHSDGLAYDPHGAAWVLPQSFARKA